MRGGAFFPSQKWYICSFLKTVGFFLLFLPFIIILNSFMSLLSKITFVNKSPLFPASVVLEKIKLLRRSSFYLWIVWVSILLHPPKLRPVFTWKDDLSHFWVLFLQLSVLFWAAYWILLQVPQDTDASNIFFIVECYLHDPFCNEIIQECLMNSTAFYHSHSNVLGVPIVWVCPSLLLSFGLQWWFTLGEKHM